MTDIKNSAHELRCAADFLRDYGMPDTADICLKAADEIERLRAIVDKQPKCWRLNEQGELVQDVAIMPGMEVYVLLLLPNEQIEIPRDTVVSVQWFGGKSTDNTIVNLQTYTSKLPFCLYSTREAAEAAKEK